MPKFSIESLTLQVYLKRRLPRLYSLIRFFIFDFRNTLNNLILRVRFGRRSAQIARLKGIAAGEVVYILATGPSIRKVELGRLHGKSLIAVNAAIKLIAEVDPRIAVHMIIDTNRVLEIGYLRSQKVTHYVRSFTTPVKMPLRVALFGDLLQAEDVYLKPFLRLQGGYVLPVLDRNDKLGAISEDLIRGFYDTGNTVVFGAIQMAHYMGAREIVLCGVDMTFTSEAKTNYGVHMPGIHVANIDSFQAKIPYMLNSFREYQKQLNVRNTRLSRFASDGALDFLPVYEEERDNVPPVFVANSAKSQ